ncbi:MAG: class I SAM-dependent methyltransferase, partial [Anaerolineae bacterium]
LAGVHIDADAPGDIALHLTPHFGRCVAVDLDARAVARAAQKPRPGNLRFWVMNAEQLAFKPAAFEVVICSHIYEHVPHPERMMAEIYRVLKPGGLCYFAAGNKLKLVDPEYRLPLATMLPKAIAGPYARLVRGVPGYYETFMTLPGLKKLVRRFEVTDYTTAIINEPGRFHATDMVRPGTVKHRLARLAARLFYVALPAYIWILKKPASAGRRTEVQHP